MDQTLEFFYITRRNKKVKNMVEKALNENSSDEMIIDRYKLSFDPDKQEVSITRASYNVPWACKIGGCRMPYSTMIKLLNNDFCTDGVF